MAGFLAAVAGSGLISAASQLGTGLGQAQIQADAMRYQSDTSAKMQQSDFGFQRELLGRRLESFGQAGLPSYMAWSGVPVSSRPSTYSVSQGSGMGISTPSLLTNQMLTAAGNKFGLSRKINKSFSDQDWDDSSSLGSWGAGSNRSWGNTSSSVFSWRGDSSPSTTLYFNNASIGETRV
uniref:VP2 n=1 Tax=Fujian spotted paddle-tail newt calicivirus TaxID=2116168 RepID=A0A2P1GMK2_9CALI|nr:VP2 [Fujian spotted paddle-tail newt calicivirus]